jgi:hypothetical protein
MRKLTVDEIIGGLIKAYEKLLMVMTNTESSPGEYHHAIGEVKALRWVLGQEHQSALDSSMPEDTMQEDEIFEYEEAHKYAPKEDE